MPNVTTTYDTATVTYDQSSLSYDGYPAPLANMPAVGVFIAWADGPYVASPAWTEVSQYVRAVDIRRGRGDDLQQFPPGGASVTLDNRDRLFDPFNTSGANYANLKPRRQIKIVANWAGVEYPLFRGFIAGWPVEYTEGGLDSTVTIDCFDLLGLMATETVPVDWANYYTKSLDVRRYWQMNDSATSSVARDQPRSTLTPIDIPFSRTGIYPGFDKQGMAEGLSGSSLFFTYSQGVNFNVPNPVTNATITTWVDFSSTTVTSYATLENYVNNVFVSFSMQVESTQSRFAVQADNGTTRSIYQYTFPTNKAPFFYAALITANAGGTPTIQLYRNLQLLTPAVTSTLSGTTYDRDGVLCAQAQFQEVATFDRLLSVDEITLLYNTHTARLPETTTARMQRITATTSIPAAWQSFPTTPYGNVSEFKSGNGIVPEMQLVANSEGGPLLVDRAGVLVLKHRYWWSSETRSNTSQMTFTDIGTGVEYDASAVRYRVNADQVRNDVTVQFTGAGSVDVVDSGSVAEIGAASETVSTLLASPSDALTLANLRLSLYASAKLGLDPFLVKGQADPAYNWPRLLALELLDRVTFKRTPATGSAVQRDLLVQSIEHRITPGTWETVVNGSTRYTGWFILGTSLLGSSEDVLL